MKSFELHICDTDWETRKPADLLMSSSVDAENYDAALKLANLTYQNGDLMSAKAMVKEVLNKHGDDLDIKKVADQLNGLMQVGMPSLN